MNTKIQSAVFILNVVLGYFGGKWWNMSFVGDTPEHEDFQNAVFCSKAAYEVDPVQYLKNTQTQHTVSEVVAVGEYIADGLKQKCLFAISRNADTEETSLIIAFKGSESSEDWSSNISYDQKSDKLFKGTFHGGFLSRANTVSLADIQNLARDRRVNKIITCGHSLGGAVATIVHLGILRIGDQPVKRNNIINLTFGAPYIGNIELQMYVRKNDLDRTMFLFASTDDIVPSVLSLGHTQETLLSSICSKEEEWKKNLVKEGYTFGIKEKSFCLLFKKYPNAAIKMLYLPGFPGSTRKLIEEAWSKVPEVQSRKTSTLYNKYQPADFVPMGRVILLGDGSIGWAAELGETKETEMRLQLAVEMAAEKCSFKRIMDGHAMDTYIKHLKELYKFKKFPVQEITNSRISNYEAFSQNFKYNIFDSNHFITLTSSGPAADWQGSKLGQYERYVRHDGRTDTDTDMNSPVYRQSHNNADSIGDGSRYIYRADDDQDWIVGPTIGESAGWLSNPSTSASLPTKGWEYGAKTEGWHSDSDLSILPGPLPDCGSITISQKQWGSFGIFHPTHEYSMGRRVYRQDGGNQRILFMAMYGHWVVRDTWDSDDIIRSSSSSLCPCDPRASYNERIQWQGWHNFDKNKIPGADITVSCSVDRTVSRVEL